MSVNLSNHLGSEWLSGKAQEQYRKGQAGSGSMPNRPTDLFNLSTSWTGRKTVC